MARLNHRKKKPLVPIIIFVVGMVLFVWVKLYNQKNIASAEIDTRLKSAAGSLEMIVNDSMIDNAQQKIPVNFVDHEYIRVLANKIAKIHDVIYVYVMIESEDSALFVFSSYIESDITGDIVTDYLDYYYEATPTMMNAFSSNDPEIYDSSQDQWGNFRSIYLPKKTRTGTPYLLCADVNMSEVVDYQLRYMVEFALSAVFLFLISLPLFIKMRQTK
ncbi:MAG TPA: hypothetical protein PKY63_06110 [Bacteroidales bacterium]|nr:hypothetical protein [Bacteroidales bacterium]